jgi:UDP-2-acetamido-3-amino-2,3-dideoxy-glucuronate N-acetyltransferase
MKEIKLAIIGTGKWGINHVRTAYDLLKCDLKLVCDLNKEKETEVKAISESIKFDTNLNSAFEDKEINSVIIATPAETHYDLAKKFLVNKKNILVEKPITFYASQAEELIKLSNQYKKKLMVGHVLLYHPAITKLKEIICNDVIGKIQYIYSNRLNLGSVRSEENILWSFAPHDISIVQYLLDNKPINIYAHGASFLQSKIEDTTLTYLEYPDNIHVHIFVSWLHPFKEHRLVVIGNKGMIVFEDSLTEDKLKYYPKGFTKINHQLTKFEGKFETINFDNHFPLEEEQKHFFNSIIYDKEPLTNGYHALEVLKILEEAQKKLLMSDKLHAAEQQWQ